MRLCLRLSCTRHLCVSKVNLFCRAYAGDDVEGSAYLQALALSLTRFHKTLSMRDIYTKVIDIVSSEDQVK